MSNKTLFVEKREQRYPEGKRRKCQPRGSYSAEDKRNNFILTNEHGQDNSLTGFQIIKSGEH